MIETTMRLVVDFRERLIPESVEGAAETMSLGELLYHVLFGDGSMEPVQEMRG
jgi:hypothetical protein